MAEPSIARRPGTRSEELSLFAVALIVMRRRRLVGTLIAIGAAIGFGLGLATPREYQSHATFLPQDQQNSSNGLALAASQLRLRLPAGSSEWGPPVYVEVLQSRAVLDSITSDTITVPEQGNRHTTVAALMGVDASSSSRRLELAARALRRRMSVEELKDVGGVEVSVHTRWPSVSLALAQRLVQGVNRFNLDVRKSQAAAERQFVDGQAAQAERDLRAAEDRLQDFLQSNHSIVSPELVMARDRLQREVELRQELELSWLKNSEDARIREVRDTPVITVLEEPELPTVGLSRKVVLKTVVGALGGVLFGACIALLSHWLAAVRGTRDPEEREFLDLARSALPGFLRRLRTTRRQPVTRAALGL